MITRIELANFMSHSHTVIEPAAGLTVLVGPNNVGKSAVVAALQILCHNENSTYVLRHGERECSVKVETDDGHTIEWRRKTSPSYVIDGQTFDRLRNSGLPDELHVALRLPKVDSGGEADFDLHFAVQKLPIFLLASSPANAARFFASSSDAIRLVAMQKRHKEKLSEAQRETVRLEAQSKRINEQLEVLEPVVELDRRLDQLERTHDELVQTDVLLLEANRLEAALAMQYAVEAEHAAYERTLKPLPTPPALFSTDSLEKLVRDLASALVRHETATSLSDPLSKLPLVPLLVATDQLANLIALTGAAKWTQMTASLTSSALELLSSPPPLQNTAGLETHIERMEIAAATIERGDIQLQQLSRLCAPPPLADAELLSGFCQRAESYMHEHECLSAVHRLLDTLAGTPVLVNDVPLNRLVAARAQIDAQIAALIQLTASLGVLAQPPLLTTTDNLADLVRRLEQSAAHLLTCENVVEAAGVSLGAAAADLRVGAAGKLCPLCGGAIDPDQLVANAAAGRKVHNHA